jgi:hypothetical protein
MVRDAWNISAELRFWASEELHAGNRVKASVLSRLSDRYKLFITREIKESDAYKKWEVRH